MDGIFNSGDTDQVRMRLLYLAWRRHRITADDANELVQRVLDTYRQSSDEATGVERARTLVRIFRDECREHLRHTV